MIAYYFPPLGGAGVQRTTKFAKYLAQAGWQVRVITVEPPVFEVQDASLLDEIKSERIQIYRVAYEIPWRGLDHLPGGWRLRALLEKYLLFPDRMAGWLLPVLQLAEKICLDRPGITVYTTSAPYTAHLIGQALKEKYSITWIADFRDEWSENPYLKLPAWLIKRHQQAEKEVLLAADAVLSVTENITQGLAGMVPEAQTVFRTIPNGFDPDDFKGLVLSDIKNSPCFIIAHLGTLNQARMELIKQLVKEVQQLVESGQISAQKLRISLIGSGGARLPELPEWVEWGDYLPHQAALAVMANSQLLVLAEPNPAAFTGKVFEYLGLGKPILGMVHPASPAASLILEAEAGWVVGLSDSRELIGRVILTTYQAWEEQQRITTPRLEVITRYNRQHQAAQLAALIEEVSVVESKST